VNKAGVALTINGESTLDDKLDGLGLPRIGEIFNIPLFNTQSVTLTGGSGLNTIF
jgi:hypothetical protein